MTDMTPAARRRLRPDSDRARNQLRLLWLLAWTVPDIAAHFAIATSTAYRRLAVYGLKGPETRGEQARLMGLELESMIGDALACGNRRAAKELMALRTGPAAPRPQAAPAEWPEKEGEEPYKEDWRNAVLNELGQVGIVGRGHETKHAGIQACDRAEGHEGPA